MKINGEIFKRKREKAGLTVEELSQKTEVPAHFIYRVENSKLVCPRTTEEMLRRLVKELRIKRSSLFKMSLTDISILLAYNRSNTKQRKKFITVAKAVLSYTGEEETIRKIYYKNKQENQDEQDEQDEQTIEK